MLKFIRKPQMFASSSLGKRSSSVQLSAEMLMTGELCRSALAPSTLWFGAAACAGKTRLKMQACFWKIGYTVENRIFMEKSSLQNVGQQIYIWHMSDLTQLICDIVVAHRTSSQPVNEAGKWFRGMRFYDNSVTNMWDICLTDIWD